jgi:hypothetical protein
VEPATRKFSVNCLTMRIDNIFVDQYRSCLSCCLHFTKFDKKKEEKARQKDGQLQLPVPLSLLSINTFFYFVFFSSKKLYILSTQDFTFINTVSPFRPSFLSLPLSLCVYACVCVCVVQLGFVLVQEVEFKFSLVV